MSQVQLGVASSPSVAVQFTGDSGTAVPVGNNLNLLGADTTENNDNGIRTVGAGDTMTVQLTNRATGQITTTDATITTIITFSAGASPGIFIIDNGNICGYNATDGGGGAYFFTAGVSTNGAATTELGSEFPTEFESVTMEDSDMFFTVAGNNILVQVKGIVGKTINWNASFTYRVVS